MRVSDFEGTSKEFILPPPVSTGWAPVAPTNGRQAPINGVNRARKKVRERHKMVMFLHCAGWQNSAIAAQLGYSQSQVSTIVNSDHPELLAIKAHAQQLVESTTLDVMHMLRREAVRSVNTLVDVRDNSDDFAQKRLAARDILDRAGYSPVRKQMNLNTEVPFERLEAALSGIENANEVDKDVTKWAVSNPGR